MGTSISMRRTACWQLPTNKICCRSRISGLPSKHATKCAGSALEANCGISGYEIIQCWADKSGGASLDHHKSLYLCEIPRLAAGLSQALPHPELRRSLNGANRSNSYSKVSCSDTSLSYLQKPCLQSVKGNRDSRAGNNLVTTSRLKTRKVWYLTEEATSTGLTSQPLTATCSHASAADPQTHPQFLTRNSRNFPIYRAMSERTKPIS